jgi:hypothetical protein
MHADLVEAASIATVKRGLKKRQDRVYEKVVAGKRAVGADLSRPIHIKLRMDEIMCLSVIFNEMIVRWRNLCSRFLRSIMQHQMSHGSDTVFE